MKPSDVILFRAVLPLIATFGRAEKEFAAALLVRACVQLGDKWQPLTSRQVGEAMKKDGEPGGCWEKLKTNPFLPNPDLDGLATDGCITFSDDRVTLEFTAKGLEVLRQKATREGLSKT